MADMTPSRATGYVNTMVCTFRAVVTHNMRFFVVMPCIAGEATC